MYILNVHILKHKKFGKIKQKFQNFWFHFVTWTQFKILNNLELSNTIRMAVAIIYCKFKIQDFMLPVDQNN